MGLENQVARVSQGTKDTLKALINMMGGNITDELIDQYPAIASQLLPPTGITGKTVTVTAKEQLDAGNMIIILQNGDGYDAYKATTEGVATSNFWLGIAKDTVLADATADVISIAYMEASSDFVVEQNKGKDQKFWVGTQEEYDALTSKDENTMYITVDGDGNFVDPGDMKSSVYDPQGKATDIFAYVDNHTSDITAHITDNERTVWNAKQDAITGVSGQVVGFDENGKPIATSAPSGVSLASIYISTAPDKTDYKAGEHFDPSGMVVRAEYTNGFVVIARDILITGWSVYPSGRLEAGCTTVSIQYTEGGVTKTALQNITVTRTSILIPSQAMSLTYSGETQYPTWSNFDEAKMQIGGITSAVNSGSYDATFSLKDTDLFCWSDGSLDDKTVSWTIDKANGELSISKTEIILSPDLIQDTFTVSTNCRSSIIVDSSDSSIAVVSVDGYNVTVCSVNNNSGSAIITVNVQGDDNHNAPNSVVCSVQCAFISIYGVQWDGTSTTAMSRTDAAAGFTDPVPAVSNGSGSSPFDNLLPWSGMTRVTDSVAGELVAIPKFWYKFTKSGNTLKLQIADGQVDGFYVSPAHADRGDGKGERDIVYVGRYHCASGYKSTTGVAQQVSITRSTARTNIHNLGTTIWQFDYAMRLTIQMLYLVEFADWNSQAKIGYGCSASGSKANNGQTDAMQYHTGTTAANRTTYGFTQYRYIEGLWDNVYDWMDGCYYNSSGMNVILNPNNFSDSANGTSIGTPPGGWISAFNVVESGGVQWLCPSGNSGSDSTYIPDYWSFSASSPCLRCGGGYGQNLDFGLFYVNCSGTSSTNANIGCRLQKLP